MKTPEEILIDCLEGGCLEREEIEERKDEPWFTESVEAMKEYAKQESNRALSEIIEALLACETTLKAFLPDAFATISIVEQAIKKAKGKSQ